MAEAGAIFIKIGAAMEDFNRAVQQVVAKANKLEHDTLIRPRVDASKIEELNNQLNRLKADAAETREHLKMSMPAEDAAILRDGLKEINAEISRVSNQLKSRTWSMGLSDLKQSIRETEAEIRRLRKELLQEKLSPDVDETRVEALNAALKDAETRLRDTKQAADDMQESMTALGKRIEAVGIGLSKYVTAPLVAAGAALTAISIKTADYAKELTNLAAITGLSMERLQELKFVAETENVSFEQMTQATVVFQRRLMGAEGETGNMAEALSRLGISIYDSNGRLKSMNLLFPEVIKGLQGMTNETERNMLAAQLFGRGTALTPILAKSAEELDRAIEQAHEYGVVMGDTTVKAMAAFSDAVELVKQRVAAITLELAKAATPVLRDVFLPILDAIGSKLGAVAKWFAGLHPVLRNFLAIVGAILAALGPMLIIIGKLYQLLPLLATAVRVVGAALMWLAANPVGAVIAAVGVLIIAVTALVSAFKAAKESASEMAHAATEIAKEKTTNANAVASMAQEYEELSKKTNKSNAELERMSILLAKIKTLAPELIGADGKLISGAMGKAGEEALRRATEQRKAELKEARVKAQEELDEARQNVKDAIIKTAGPAGRIAAGLTSDQIDKALKSGQIDLSKLPATTREKYEIAQARLRKSKADEKAGPKFPKQEEDNTALLESEARAAVIERQIAKDRADALTKIEMDKQDALAAAEKLGAGALEKAAIEKQFAYKAEVEMAKQAEAAAKKREQTEKEALREREKRQNEEKRLQKEREAALKAHVEEMTRIAVAEGKAAVQARLSEMRRGETQELEQSGLTGLDMESAQAELERTIGKREADMAYALALGDLQRGAKPGEDISKRAALLAEERLSKIADIESRYADESKRIQDERARAAVEANLKIEESNKSAWQAAMDTLETYADRVAKTLLGEQAMREQQLDRQRSKERAALEESIKDSALRAKVLQAFDVETEAQRKEIFAQEEVRDDARINMLERLKRMTGISSVEGLWRQMANTNLQSAFEGIAGGANFTMQAQMPKIETKELNQTNEILADIRRLQAQSEENTRIMRNELERTK